MQRHTRGNPFIPLLVVIDTLAGYSQVRSPPPHTSSQSSCLLFLRQTLHLPLRLTYQPLQVACNTAAVSWGIFTSNSQAAETKWLTDAECPVQLLVDLFELQVRLRVSLLSCRLCRLYLFNRFNTPPSPPPPI